MKKIKESSLFVEGIKKTVGAGLCYPSRFNKFYKFILTATSIFICSNIAAFSQSVTNSETLASSNNAFALDLFHSMSKAGNLVFSPYSISTALAMAWTGSRKNTETQMAQVLHFSGGQKEIGKEFKQLQKSLNDIGKKGDVELDIANSLWLNKDFQFNDTYLEDVGKNYAAKLSKLDFNDTVSATNTINQWIEHKTDKKIKDLLKPNDLSQSANEKMGIVLVSAVYFLGNWVKQFEINQTHPRPFYLLNGSPVTVQMMTQTESFSMAKNNEAQILELPYQGEKLSMILILPNKRDGLTGLEKDLTSEKLNNWFSSLRKNEVFVRIPKFKLTYGAIDLIPGLKSLGITDAFDKQLADFSGMLPPKYSALNKLYIKFVLHKAYIAIDETGTEAAAATGSGGVLALGSTIGNTIFDADHPFLFLILSKQTNGIIFWGRITDPTFLE